MLYVQQDEIELQHALGELVSQAQAMVGDPPSYEWPLL